MSWNPPRRLFDWPWRSRAQIRRDIDAELAHHLYLVERECERAGMTPDAARTEARRRLGDMAGARREMIRDDRKFETRNRLRFAGQAFTEDVRYAFRTFRDQPFFAVVTLGTLTVGIATATVFFGAVHSILLRPLALDDPDRVVSVWGTEIAAGVTHDGLAPATIADIRERSRSLEALAAAQPHSFDVAGSNAPISVNSWVVSEDFFKVLRTVPAAGRLLGSGDFLEGDEHVVVLTHAFWTSHFGGDATVVGSTMALDNEPYRVVGVVPADFPQRSRDLFVPRPSGDPLWESRFASFLSAFGRLRPGVSIESARADLREVAGQLALDYPDANEGRGLELEDLRADIVGDVSQGLWLLLAAAILILVVSCINAAGLLLAQATTRTRELAVRAAIGAGHGRLMRQLLTETSILAAAAAAFAIPIAAAGLGIFQRASPQGMPRIEELTPDYRIVVIASITAFAVALLVGLVPALRVARPDLYEVLKPGGRSGTLTPATARFRSALVCSEVAIAVLLLVGGGLLFRSWGLIQDTDQGYSATGIAAVETHFWQFHEDEDAEGRAEFARLVTERLKSVPGVQSAAVSTSLPLAEQIGNEDGVLLRPADVTPTAVRWMAVSPGYFETLGVSHLAGRPFDVSDVATSEPVAIINAESARRLWPGEDPVGQSALVGGNGEATPTRIVGVVSDVRYAGLEADPGPTVYVPHAQAGEGSVYFVVRTAGEPGHQLLRQVLADIQPGLVLADEVALADLLVEAGKPRRFSLMLLSVFGFIALLLTVVGLFGHMSHNVRTREHELGIRMALGAWPGRLIRMVLRQGLVLVALGTVTGLVLAFGLSRFMSALLYGVAPSDPVTFGAAAVLVFCVGLAASYLPARRVSRVDPVVALRTE